MYASQTQEVDLFVLPKVPRSRNNQAKDRMVRTTLKRHEKQSDRSQEFPQR